MAVSFDVSFQESLAGLQELNARLSGLGPKLDLLESKGVIGATRYRSALDTTTASARKMALTLQRSGADAETAHNVAQQGANRATKSYQRMADSAVTAAATAAELKNSNSQLRDVLLQTAVNEDYVRRERKKAVQQAREYIDANANLRSIISQMSNAEKEQAVTGQRLAWGYETLNQRSAELSAQQQRAKAAVDNFNRSMVEGQNNIQAYTGENHRAAQAARRLAQEEESATNSRRQELDQLRNAMEQTAQAEQRYQSNARETVQATRLQTTSEARLREERERHVAGAKAYNDSLMRQARSARDAELATGKYASQLKRLQASAANGSSDKLNNQLSQLARNGREATSSLSVLGKQEAELESRESRLVSKIEMRNKATRKLAQATNVLSNAEARQVRKMEESITQYSRQAQYASMTSAELLGLSSGHSKLSREMSVNAQAAAAFRAALGGLNSSIGIYTSATVLMASATYATAAALRETVSAGMEFNKTMSRAEAIMMSGSDHLTDSVSTMSALESQVRSLGQSTVFTATEVSSGLVDLGMAGLSSAEAMRGLKPALDLASIGSIDMSESADIATNVMTTFRISASDLGEVVNVLSTAISNSNTDIQKLANALSYVGPAAKAAGFELRDTVAAIELLSNAGVKSSKAGTGLRRFMLSIQNPTSKGADVLREYGIALDDARGQTRSLMDILGQFNDALHRDAIAPAERMSAIVDLVGVRAASAVSRMVSSVDELGVLRRQLDNVSGAAEEMRATIEDNLASDWDKLKSAFQDVQLEVFEEFQWSLRELALTWTDTFQKMTIEDDTGVSQLDRLIATVHKLTDAAIGAGAAFIALKAGSAGKNIFGAMASGAGKAADRMRVMARRAKASTLIQLRQTKAVQGSTVAIHGQTNAMISANAAGLMFTKTLQGLAVAGAAVGRALSWFMRIAGWVGIIWGAYTAIKSAFGDTDSYVQTHKDRIQSLKEDYKDLNKEIEKTQQEKSRKALTEQRENSRKELSRVDDQLNDYRQMRPDAQGEDALQAIDDRISMLQRRREELNQTFLESGQALRKLGASKEQISDITEEQDYFASIVAKSTRELNDASEAMQAYGIGAEAVQEQNVEMWRKAKLVAEGYFSYITAQKEEMEKDNPLFIDDLNKALEDQRTRMDDENRFENQSTTEKMIELEKELAMRKAEVASMDAMGVDKSLSRYERVKSSVMELGESLNDLRYEYQDLAADGSATYEELISLQRDDAQSIEDLRSRLAGLNAQRMGMIASAVVNNTKLDVEAVNNLLDKQVELMKSIGQQEEENQRKAERAAREAERERERERRELENKMDQYRKILESADEVRAATAKFNDQSKTLQSLLDGGHIEEEDYNAALDVIRDKYWDNVAAGDAYIKTVRDLNEEIAKGGEAMSAGGWIQNMRVAETWQKIPHMQERGELLEQRTQYQQRQDAESAVPGFDSEAQFEDNKFGEYNNLQNTAEDVKTQAGMEKTDLQLKEMQAIFDGRLEAAENYANQRERIEQNLQDRLRQIDEQSNQAMLTGASNSFGELASITKAFAGEQSSIYKSMFAVSKAFAIANSIVNINAAIAKATASGATWQEQLAAMATVTSATAGIVSNIRSVTMATSGEGESGGDSGGGNYAGMYDKGGHIPASQYGIVGEHGPEIVHGPANVTGREETAKKRGGGGDMNINFSPNLQIDMSGSGDEEEDQRRAEEMSKTLNKQMESKFLELVHRETRPNGVLDRWKRSSR